MFFLLVYNLDAYEKAGGRQQTYWKAEAANKHIERREAASEHIETNYVWAALFFKNTMFVIAWYLIVIFLSCFLHFDLKVRKMHMICHCSNEV